MLAKTERFLKENGITYLVGVNISAIAFWGISVCCGIFVVLFEVMVLEKNFIINFITFVLGSFLPAGLLMSSNKSDNDHMLEDIKLLYEMLKIQVHAGVYIMDALDNCNRMIKNKRLQQGLNRLLCEIFMSRNINDALDNFNNSFRNTHIDTLVIILKQSMESGYSVQNLDSAFEQVVDVERAINIKMENAVERNTQILQVLFMAGIIAIAVYCSMVEFKGLFSIF